METYIKEARDCGQDMFKDGLSAASNPYMMPWQEKERDAWLEGYRAASNADDKIVN